MHHANNEKLTEGIEQTNKLRKYQNYGEKETYNYVGMFKADAIKQAGMKKKLKNTSGERGNYSKPKYIAEISLNI